MIAISPSIVVMPIAAIYGAVIGSFLANASVRLPEDRSLLPPSSCPRCGTRIRWYDNVPILSWLALRGRCRHCGQPISPVYPLVEALTAVLAALLARHLFVSWSDLDVAHVVAWLYQLGFVSLIIVMATVDARHRIIPDETSIYAVPFGILGHGLLGWLGYDGWWTIPPSLAPGLLGFEGWPVSMFLAMTTAGVFYTMFWATGRMTDFFTGLDTLGWGDVKLVAMFGAFLGPQLGLAALLLSSVFAAAQGIVFRVVLWRQLWLPFGPPAAFATIGVVLFGDIPVLRYFTEWLIGR
ncbi:MAG: prepilin peptidase [Myxococcota bacterium]